MFERWTEEWTGVSVLENGELRDFCLGAELKQGGGTEWFETVIGSEQQLWRRRERMSSSTAGRLEVPGGSW